VEGLAIGYVAAGAVVLAVYALTLVRLLRAHPLVRRARLDGEASRIRPPVRELLGFSLPLLSTNLTFTVTTTFGAVLLGHMGTIHQVASFRAVQPVAALNLMVMVAFSTLFTPVAARLHAQGDVSGMRDLYWRTTGWLAVLTLPVLLLSTVFAAPVTTMLFGHRYSSSAPVLAALSVGYYVNASLGFNGTVLQILGATRYVVIGNLATITFAVIVTVALIPPLGALGAAIAASLTVILHNIIKQAGVRRYSPVGLFDRRYTWVYLVIGIIVAGMAALLPLAPDVPVALAMVSVASVGALFATRQQLQVAATFPELRAVPVLGRLFAS
jgi:O-antigen/teichoic acid export membrane protein